MTFFKLLGPLTQTSSFFSHDRLSPNRAKRTPWLVLSLVLIASPLAVSAQTTQGQPAVAPDYAVYYGIFHHVAALNQMADAAQKQGQDRSNLRQLVRLRAGLTESQGEALNKISLQCDSDVAAQDAKAKAIIDQFHAQYPPGLINPSFPPKAPTVLEPMWQARNNVVLAARDQLRSELGDADFAKFDNFLRTKGPAPAAPPVLPPLPGASTPQK